MPLDHYVSQVHLRNFYSPTGNYLHAIRKKDLRQFRTNSRAVCRLHDGNTNQFLVEERIVEEFLRLVEPHYNNSVAKLREEQIDQRVIQTIAGFVAYVATCSPTAVRTSVPIMAKNLEATAKIMERNGLLPEPPPSLSGKTLSHLIDAGMVGFKIDPKYPQAIGTQNLFHHVSNFGNAAWEILHNPHQDSPFFTSDFPAAIDSETEALSVLRVVPLAPDLAVRILPDVVRRRASIDLAFSKFKFRSIELSRAAVRDVNKLIVRCAEDLVFYKEELDWIAGFVKRNRDYHVCATVIQQPSERGFKTAARLCIARQNTPFVKRRSNNYTAA